MNVLRSFPLFQGWKVLDNSWLSAYSISATSVTDYFWSFIYMCGKYFLSNCVRILVALLVFAFLQFFMQRSRSLPTLKLPFEKQVKVLEKVV